ncbi:MAG: S8 family serine peptidase, partial [Polyangiaceae bacterium]
MRALRLFGLAAVLLLPAQASATGPNGAAIVRQLGPRAAQVFAPNSGQIGALVAIPNGQSAAALGLEEIAPGIGRVRANAAGLLAYADAHPGLQLEVSPPLHMLNDHASTYVHSSIARANFHVDGTGVLVGVADTGLDVNHPDMLDADGKTRVAWMIDLSKPPLGKWPELEAKYGVKNDQGVITNGAVFSGDDINALLAFQQLVPHDEVGHGTHVTSIAAGNGGKTVYGGIAPKATLVIARVTRSAADAIDNDDLLRGVGFIYDRADFLKKPVVVNLSLGGDYGPHDGTALWEKSLASFIGPTHPGRALVVAAGNSGSILETPVHQSVRVTKGTQMRVPVNTTGSDNGGVDIWVSMRSGASVDIGLDGPDGQWISAVSNGSQRGKNTSDYTSGVFNGQTAGSPIPGDSHGGVVIWQGKWPAGTYNVTLAGEGTVDLFMQASGDAASSRPVGFAGGVREGTINLPATHPDIIAVGCTVNRTKWISIAKTPVALHVPLLDGVGGLQDPSKQTRELEDGEMCWFSSAGPTVTGVPKPEISAPGGIVVAAMSNQAKPGSPGSIFTTDNCPGPAGTKPDIRCFQVDATHAVAVGTSMSAPMVAGAVALLFQRDPTLTQDKIVALLQAGAHPFRGSAPFEDQGGPG